MSPAPVFVTGPARSGTTLVARMLDAHPRVALASDPLFPLLRGAIGAILRGAAIPGIDPDGPIQDYHFADERIRALDAVLGGSLDLELDPALLPSLRDAIAARAAHEAPALVPLAGRLVGETWAEAIRSALGLVAEAAGGTPRAVGTKEVWTIDLLPALGRAFPEARFVVVLRDPRAIVASLERLAASEPDQGAHALSYARHWRKHVALLERFQDDPLLAGRLAVVRYEDLVADPARGAAQLARIAGVSVDEAMLAAGGLRANSSHGDGPGGIRPELAERWRSAIDPRAQAMVELTCGPELGLWGYRHHPDAWRFQDVLAYLRELDRAPGSWRSDLGDPELDLVHELRRRSLVVAPGTPEPAQIRRAFLFPEHWRRLRSAAAVGSSAEEAR